MVAITKTEIRVAPRRRPVLGAFMGLLEVGSEGGTPLSSDAMITLKKALIGSEKP